MKKILAAIITIAVVIAGAFLAYINHSAQSEIFPETAPVPITSVVPNPNDTATTSVVKKSEIVHTLVPGKLMSKTWTWVGTTHGNGEATTPHNPNTFTLTFKEKTFSVTTDCNGVGGEYTVSGNQITFEKMISTLMYCEGSQEGKFSQMLSEAKTFSFDGEGNLKISLKTYNGTMVFK